MSARWFAPLSRLLALPALMLLLLVPAVGASATQPDDADLLYFWGEGCPVCVQAEDWLGRLERANPDLTVARYEVWNDRANEALFAETLAERGERVTAVPTFVIGEQVWVGFSEDQLAPDLVAALGAEPAVAAEDEGIGLTGVLLIGLGIGGVGLAVVALTRAGSGRRRR